MTLLLAKSVLAPVGVIAGPPLTSQSSPFPNPSPGTITESWDEGQGVCWVGVKQQALAHHVSGWPLLQNLHHSVCGFGSGYTYSR